MTKLHTVRVVTVNAFKQTKMRVRSYLGGRIHTEQKGELLTKYGVIIMKSVHDLIQDRPFDIFVSNLSSSDRLIAKGINIGYATRPPLELISLTGPGAQEMCDILKIFTTKT